MTIFHQQLPANTTGRDFIVGDLHGCLDLLQIELERVRFDPTQDRLFSVGDLADRGPYSLRCLRLLHEPWFYAVVGNHEDMLLTYYQKRDSTYHSAPDFLRNGGRWVHELDEEESSELVDELLPLVLALPYVITVGQGEKKFHIAHAELMTGSVDDEGLWQSLRGLPGDRDSAQILTDASLTDEVLSKMATPLTWGRRLVRKVNIKDSVEINTPQGKLLLSQQPWHPDLSLTFVGHTPLAQMVMHESHFFTDRGAYRRELDTSLLVVDQKDVREWLSTP